MSTHGATEIIRGLSLIDDSDANVQRLAESLNKDITILKEMDDLKSETGINKSTFAKLHKAATKIKAEIDALSPFQKDVLWGSINHKYKIEGFEKYPSPSEICELLTPIERCSESINANKVLKKDGAVDFMDCIDDGLGRLYVEATGKALGRSYNDNDGPSGPLYRYISAVFELAGIERKPSTAVIGIVERSKHHPR